MVYPLFRSTVFVSKSNLPVSLLFEAVSLEEVSAGSAADELISGDSMISSDDSFHSKTPLFYSVFFIIGQVCPEEYRQAEYCDDSFQRPGRKMDDVKNT